jgi:hypothetical protein
LAPLTEIDESLTKVSSYEVASIHAMIVGVNKANPNIVPRFRDATDRQSARTLGQIDREETGASRNSGSPVFHVTIEPAFCWDSLRSSHPMRATGPFVDQECGVHSWFVHGFSIDQKTT